MFKITVSITVLIVGVRYAQHTIKTHHYRNNMVILNYTVIHEALVEIPLKN